MISVLVVGAGAAWEQRALTRFDARTDVVVLRRCVDVNDLLAVATLGQADAAVVGLDAPGFDVAAVEHLRRHRVRVVGVAPAGDDASRARAGRMGVRAVVGADDVDGLVEALVAPPPPDPTTPRTVDPDAWHANGVGAAGSPHVPGDRPGSGDGRGGWSDLPGATHPRAAGVAAGAPAVPSWSAEPTRPRAEGVGPAGPADPGVTPPTPPTVVAVWGPAGAPGRTTLATSLAAALARRGEDTLLVDADPWGGAVAQQLAIVDDVSGMLQLARGAVAGDLAQTWTTAVRRLGPHLHVVTGLPRPERWDEVPGDVLVDLLAHARGAGHVVVDTGFSLEVDESAALAGRPERNALTLAALEAADVVVAVGTADPVGLARLARGLADLHEVGVDRAGGGLHVVLNRTRASLGWSPTQLRALLADVAGPAPAYELPDDRAATDRALVTGRHLLESGDGPLVRALVALADAVVPPARTPVAPGRRPVAGRSASAAGTGLLRRRTAGTARRR